MGPEFAENWIPVLERRASGCRCGFVAVWARKVARVVCAVVGGRRVGGVGCCMGG